MGFLGQCEGSLWILILSIPGFPGVSMKRRPNPKRSHAMHGTSQDCPRNPGHCKKGFVILTIIFFTRVATVDMVLWEDTRIVPHDSQLWAIQCT